MPNDVGHVHMTVSGRRLEVLIEGPADGPALVFHRGTPSAALPFRPLTEAAGAHGLRLITWSRPGYGGSEPAPGRSVADVASDTAAVLDALAISEFVTLGWSGGGPHALACAALLPGRCKAAGTIAGIAPYSADGLDWMAGMGTENVEEYTLALRGEQALTPYLEEQALVLGQLTGLQVAQALGGLLTPVDAASLTGEFAEFVAAVFRRAVSSGVAGWRDDDLALTRDWGFDISTVGGPVAVWQGGQDRMVPPAHGRWLVERIPDVRDHLHPGEGHLSLAVAALDRIVADLVDLAWPSGERGHR